MLISLSLKQAAAILGCSKKYVRDLVKEGKIHAFKTSDRLGYKIPYYVLEDLGIPPSIVERLAQKVALESSKSFCRNGYAPAIEPFRWKGKALKTSKSLSSLRT